MTQSVCILGRQPALGIAELESLYGAEKLRPINSQAVMLDCDSSTISFNRMGGTIKLGRLLTTLDTVHWPEIAKWLAHAAPEHLQYVPEGKLQLGLSVYGLPVTVSRLNASGLEVKKAIKATGRSVRLIPNKNLELNSAQVLHNHLTGPLGWEFLFVRDGHRTLIAQTVAIQDIEAYAARDQARPKRDARVGMLPPKLAQIIINLAVGQQEDGRWKMEDGQNKNGPPIVLDPFCGTGVLVQEALLMGYRAVGADIDMRIGEYFLENMDWLKLRYPDTYNRIGWQLADATSDVWQTSEFFQNGDDARPVSLKFDMIASETYLGRPFSALPKPEILSKVSADVDTIHRKFLRNVARQTKPGLRMCIAIPAWKTQNSFKHLPILDQLTDLGYNRISFVHASNQELIYHRPEQIVARELVVLVRK